MPPKKEMTCPMPDVKNILPGLKKPKSGINYDSESLRKSFSYDHEQTLAKNILNKIDGDVEVIQISPQLGGLTHALLASESVSQVIVFDSSPFFVNNINNWGLGPDVTIEHEHLDAKDVKPESVIVLDLHDPDSFYQAVDVLQSNLISWSEAKLIVLRTEKSFDLPAIGYQVENVSEDPNEDIYYLTVNRLSDKTWEKDLKQFLDSFLPHFIQEDVKKYTSKDAMKYWKIAFTHESVDPKNNYEDLELLGDRFLEAAFTKYLYKSIDGITKSQVNNVKSFYVQKRFLKNVAMKFGLDKFIRTTNLTIHAQEDSFESFMGGLVEVSDSIVEGLSYINCFNFVIWAFDDVEFDLEYVGAGNATMIVDQFMKSLNIRDALAEDVKPEGDKFNFTLSLKPFAVARLAQLGKTVPAVIGRGVHYTQNEARNYAYEMAKKIFWDVGIRKDWIRQQKEGIALDVPGVVEYKDQALAKARRMKPPFVALYFQKSRTTTTNLQTAVNLMGKLEDGTEKILTTGYARGADMRSASVDAIRKWTSC